MWTSESCEVTPHFRQSCRSSFSMQFFDLTKMLSQHLDAVKTHFCQLISSLHQIVRVSYFVCVDVIVCHAGLLKDQLYTFEVTKL